MNTRERLWGDISVVALTSILLAASAAPVAAQQGQPAAPAGRAQTPLAGVAPGERDYPEGNRLQAAYETFAGGIPLPEPRTGERTRATVGFSAALEIQSRLPQGFTLEAGDTARVMDDLPEPTGQAQSARPGRPSPEPDVTRAAGPSAGAAELPEEGAAPSTPAKYITLYPVQFQGIPLSKGSDVLSIVSEDGLLLATRERGLPSAVDATEPTVPPQAAVEAVRATDRQGRAAERAQVSEPQLEIWVDDQQLGHLTWTFTVESPSLVDPEAQQYWVAAVGEPEVIHSESLIYHTHFGTTSGTLWETTPLRSTGNRPLSDLEVSRTGAGGGMAITGEDGRYGFTTGTGSATLKALLKGPNSVVQNQAGANMQVSKTGTPSNPTDLNFGASGEFPTAQVSAFYWTNFAQDLARDILAPADLPALPTRVNIANSCNAFWNGSSINFFRAGGQCPNTAYSDVVLHEYGHGVDHRKGGILDGGYSEGFGDAMAILGTRQPCLGRDFLGAGTCLRPATDVITWPPASGEGVHAIGRRYAGFTWELVDQLKNTYSDDGAFDLAKRLVMAAALANPSNIPDAVRLSILADDDDGDLGTCSPHQRDLEAAADSRNIPRPADCSAPTGMALAAFAHFSFTDQKKASSNINILQAQITLDRGMDVLLTANSSAKLDAGGPLEFRTGFFNQLQANTMWTNSLRNVTVAQANQWENFGSTFGIRLPPGTHTLYWKVWVSGGELQFSSGGLQVEAFPIGTGAIAVAALPATTTAGGGETAVRPEETVTLRDASGQQITRIEPAAGPSR